MDIADIWKYDLRKGNTDHPANGACLYDAAKWIVYGQIGDDPQCACPIIRHYAINLNDSMDNETRQLLKPFILRIVGNIDPASEAERLHYIVLETARRITPLMLEAAGLAKDAFVLRSLPDDATFSTIKDAAYTAARASYAPTHPIAHTATCTIAYTATCTIGHAADYAAIYTARATTYAADAATYAAHTTTDVAAYIWPIVIEILDGALRIGKQSPEFDEAEVRQAVEHFKRAREDDYPVHGDAEPTFIV